MKHPLLVHIAVMASMAVGVSHLPAQQIDLSLNLHYLDPTDNQSGGNWELVARADQRGIVAVNARLTSILNPVFHTPVGEVAGFPYGFWINVPTDAGSHFELTMAQVPDITPPQPLLYDVGVIGGGTMPGDNGSPSVTFDPGSTRSVPWGQADSLGNQAWDGAALLATGSFAPGTTPGFFARGNDASGGLVFTEISDVITPDITIRPAAITTIVRNNLATMMGIAGDYNNNGQVEQADLDLVLLHWGQDGTTPPPGWTNDLPSGNIDQEELDKVLLNWGAMASLGGAASLGSQNVPEPSTLALLLVAVTLGVMTQKVTFPLRGRR